MNTLNLTAALMAAGLLIAGPAFAQAPATTKQRTQEVPSMAAPTPGDPSYKQRTQEVPSMAAPTAGDPSYKQRTQEVPSMAAPTAGDPSYRK